MIAILTILSILLIGNLMIENVSSDQREVQTFRKKVFYIPHNNLLAYVHEEDGLNLVMSGMTNFISDTKTTIGRQRISKFNLTMLNKAIEIDEKNLHQYSFLTNKNLVNSWAVIEIPYGKKEEKNWETYMQGAEALKSMPANKIFSNDFNLYGFNRHFWE